MLPRLSESIDSLPQNTHFIFGAESWLSSEPAEILQQKAQETTDKNVTVHKVEGKQSGSGKKIMLVLLRRFSSSHCKSSGRSERSYKPMLVE